MKATLEFYVDKPVEYRRLKMAMEAEQAFGVLLKVGDYCRHQRARCEASGSESGVYANIIECLDNFLKTYEISMDNYKEIEAILRGQDNGKVEIKQR